jgi:hypothetical protein
MPLNDIDLISKISVASNLFVGSDDDFDAILKNAADCVGDNILVIKTHREFPEKSMQILNQDDCKVFYTFRDPAEISLSLLDVAKKETKAGLDRFTQYTTLDTTFSAIDWQIQCLKNWHKNCPIIQIFYNDLCFNTNQSITRIAKHLGMETNQEFEDLKNREESVWEFNKGILNRAESELSADDLKRFRDRYSFYYRYLETRNKEYFQFF